jgi:hypothetical protein
MKNVNIIEDKMQAQQTPTQEEKERAAQWAAFLASVTVGSTESQTPLKCVCGADATLVHGTKGHCCSSCAKDD